MRGHVVDADESLGAVHQALCAALNSELAEFYRLLAVLDQHSRVPTPMPGERQVGGRAPGATLPNNLNPPPYHTKQPPT